jgi:hypothetical protein
MPQSRSTRITRMETPPGTFPLSIQSCPLLIVFFFGFPEHQILVFQEGVGVLCSDAGRTRRARCVRICHFTRLSETRGLHGIRWNQKRQTADGIRCLRLPHTTAPVPPTSPQAPNSSPLVVLSVAQSKAFVRLIQNSRDFLRSLPGGRLCACDSHPRHGREPRPGLRNACQTSASPGQGSRCPGRMPSAAGIIHYYFGTRRRRHPWGVCTAPHLRRLRSGGVLSWVVVHMRVGARSLSSTGQHQTPAPRPEHTAVGGFAVRRWAFLAHGLR